MVTLHLHGLQRTRHFFYAKRQLVRSPIVYAISLKPQIMEMASLTGLEPAFNGLEIRSIIRSGTAISIKWLLLLDLHQRVRSQSPLYCYYIKEHFQHMLKVKMHAISRLIGFEPLSLALLLAL